MLGKYTTFALTLHQLYNKTGMKSQKIDWTQVYSYYISNEKISYYDCASRFSISVDSIKKKGSEENWTSKKQQIHKAALAITEQKTTQKLVKRNESHIALGIALQSAAAKQMVEKGIVPATARDVKDWIATGVQIERKARGMDESIRASVILNTRQTRYHITWGDGAELDEY